MALSNAERIISASISRMTAIVKLDVHGRRADCCLTVHGPGLLDNRRLFLEQQGRGRGVGRIETETKYRDGAESEKRR